MILWVGWVVPLIWAGLFATGWSGTASLVDPEPQVTCRRTVGMVRASLFGTCHPRGDVVMWWQRVPTRESLHCVKFAIIHLPKAYLVAQTVKNPPAAQETQAWSLGWKDFPEEGHGNPLQYSCLENSMNRGAWQTTVHGVAKSWTPMSD